LKPLIVTGGAGFLGGHLVRALLRTGATVTVLDKAQRPRTLPVSRRLVYRRMDVARINALAPESLPNTRIVHLAAKTSVQESVRHPSSTVRSNIGTTCAALEFARRMDSERFLFASTAAVYPDLVRSCRENDTPNPSSPYAVSKLASEHYCKVYTKLYGIPTVILRYFNIYGPEQSAAYAGVITRFVREALRQSPPVIFGDGRQTRDFVFINDVVDATISSLDKSLHGAATINIATGKATSITSLAKMILDILQLPKLRPIYASARAGDVRHSRADISLAHKMLNFRPRYELNNGLRATIDWLRAKEK
jgi:UDP-glucose 4-epimerase